MGWEVGGRLKREETYGYLRLIHADVWQKPTQYYDYPSKKKKNKHLNIEVPCDPVMSLLCIYPEKMKTYF